MRPIEHIRKNVFDVSQVAFAEIAGTTQPTISRWERGELDPGQEEMERIRSAARGRGLPWDDRLFFELPADAQPERVAS